MANKQDPNWTDIAAVFTNCITAIVAVAAAVGVWFAWEQLGLTRDQIQTTQAQIRANTIYQIAKDGREIAHAYRNKNIGPGYIFNFIHSMYRQKLLGTLDSVLWASIEKEICSLVKFDPAAQKFWNDAGTRALFPKDFVAEIQRLKTKPDCP